MTEHAAARAVHERPEPPEPILRWLRPNPNLPADARAVAQWFADLADKVMTLPRSAERSVALRKLLEGKDAAVRALLSLEPEDTARGDR